MTDNRYGIFKYGTSHKYGATTYPLNDALSWAVEVDWDGDGVFDGTNEGFYLMAAPRIVRGRRTMLRPSGQGFESVRTGTATFTLSNHDGRFDAWNTSSPLYPNVDVGKDVRIRVVDLNTGTVYSRFYGIIQDIEPVGYGTEAKVIIRADDAMRVLRDTQVIAQRPYTDGTLAPARIQDIMTTFLTAAQWPARWDKTVYGVSYGVRYWYASGERSAAVELEDLGLSFFGYVFIKSTGRFAFIDKFTDQTPVESISETELLKDIGNPQPWTIRRNVVKLRFHVRNNETDSIVWQPVDTDPSLDPGETREVFISYTKDGYPAYLENLESNIRFSQSPQEITVGAITETYTLTDYGTKAFLSLTNSNAFPVFVYMGHDHDILFFPGNYSYVRGDITWTEKTETISSPRDPSTVANQRALVLDSLWYQDKNQAYEFVDNYQDFISVQHKTPIITLENRFAKQFTPDLFDVITADIPYLGISSEDFRVGGIEEESIGETTQAVRTTFYLEPFLVPNASRGTWGAAVWDTSEWEW